MKSTSGGSHRPDVRLQLNQRSLPWVTLLNAHVDGYEMVLENVIEYPQAWLEKTAGKPLSLHSVSIFPTTEGICAARKILGQVPPDWIQSADLFSVHLAQGTLGGVATERLIPIAYSMASVEVVSGHLQRLRDLARRDILLENISLYFEHPDSEMTELEFLMELVSRIDARVLLDVENLSINIENGISSRRGLIELARSGAVSEIHIAGHRKVSEVASDTHDGDVAATMLEDLADLIRHLAVVPAVVLERDRNLPDAGVLISELARLRTCVAGALGHPA